jgi:hypothetical protein
MLRPSRFGVAAAVAVVLAGTPAPAARAADVDKFLPADAEYVVAVNVRQVLDSDIIKKYALGQIKDFLAGNDAQKFIKDLGLDPLKDVEKIVIGASGTDQNDGKALFIIHGKFDPQKLYKAAEAQTKKDSDHFSLVKDGADVMFKFQPDNGNPVYGTVINDNTVVAGTDKKLVSAALAASAGDKKPAINKDLAALVGRMDEKASVYVCALTKDKLDKLRLPPGAGAAPGLKDQLGKMDSVTATVKVTGDVTLEVNLGMADNTSADEMGKMVDDGITQIKGLLPFLVANDPNMKPLADAAKSLKSGVKGKTVSISGKLPGDAIGRLLKQGGD